MANHAADFREYVEQFPEAIRKRLNQLRTVILSVAPAAVESIRYGMPAIKVGKTTLYMAGYKNHIGIYPLHPSTTLESEIARYRAPKTKDTIHFKHKEELPIEVVRKIVEFKLGEK